MALRVVAAEDSYLIREGLAALLRADPDLDLVARVPTLPELQRAVAEHDPDVVVTDVRMPPGLGDEGIRAAEELATTHPSTGVVVLSQYVEPDWALRLFGPGASGRAYLLKERIGDLDALRHAIVTVAAGGTVLDPQVVEALVGARTGRTASPLAALTGREREVLELVAEGLSNGAVAERLHLGERAVEKHITAVFTKLGLDAGDDTVHRRVRAVLVYLSATST
ncbi:response regulator transcription factor [Pseudonocardia sp. NPDC049635]|uniref:response regulator transcription factor n=1 Tax=Pseudonocardia sp. NPDC049635 TaxID=3155506 RepID=UPI00340D985A